MIELAPQRKQGLSLAHPLVTATGAVGYAHEARELIALDRLAAIVTAALSLHSRAGSAQPRLAALQGGLLLHHGGQSMSWSRARKQFAAHWARSKAPIIAHVIGHTSLGELARRIEDAQVIAGLEYDVTTEESLTWLEGLRAATELPILARVPYGGETLALRAVEAGADALVCISPPRGAAMREQWSEGEMYGPLVKPLAMQTLRAVAALVSVPLVACGGVHSAADVREFLAAGAQAVMVDSLAWVDPRAFNQLLEAQPSA